MTFLDFADAGALPVPDDAALPAVQDEQSLVPAGPQPDQEQINKLTAWVDHPNIAKDLDDDELNKIGMRVKREYDIDFETCKPWVEKTRTSLDLAMQKTKAKIYPWPNAANVVFPLMTSAAVQFAARAYPAIVSGREVVKGVVYGNDNGIPVIDPATGGPMMDPQSGQPYWQQVPGAKRLRAERIGEHMSWQLLEEMTEWEAETDQLLHILPISGCVFRKTYFDPSAGRNKSVMVSPLNLVINYDAISMDVAPRITEEIKMYPLEIKEMERAGLFLEIPYTSEPEQKSADDLDSPREFLEQHRWWDMDGDEFPEPYIVTIHKASSKVVRIRARYDANGIKFGSDFKITKIDPIHYYTKYEFLPNPDGGIYSLGFGQLLKPINEAVNTTINQLLDSGHLANTGGGFIGKGLSMNTGAVRFTPGEYKMVNVSGSVVKDNIVPLQFAAPSMVLFQLLGLLIDAGKDIAAVKDVLTGEQQQHNVPATTTLALIEQGLKVFTAIYKRVHRALKAELEKLYRLNGIYLPLETSYRVGDTWKQITLDDYKAASGVEPVSDPTMVSDMQRLAKAQFLMQFAQDPLLNQIEIRRRVLDAASIDKIEDLIVTQKPPPDPKIIIEGMKLQIDSERQKAAELKDLAQAILFFAQADAVNGDQHLAWTQQQLTAWQAQFDAASAAAQPAGADGKKPPQPGTPEAPTPDQSAPGPGGPIGATHGIQMGAGEGASPSVPPMTGAKQASDGKWYLPDPNRTGKYLMLNQ